jgi:hypothetical protein
LVRARRENVISFRTAEKLGEFISFSDEICLIELAMSPWIGNFASLEIRPINIRVKKKTKIM